MSWSIVKLENVAPQRWKNGGGWTRELLAWPHPADWMLRVSVADIEADGPFSAFPGVDRWFGVLSGQGVRLYEYEVRPGDELLHFDGSLGPDCELLDGPTRDFNLMHRRGAGRVRVQDASKPCELHGELLMLFTAAGGVMQHGGRKHKLPALSMAWCMQPAGQGLSFQGQGAAWWICWSAE
ncbi:MAG: HutD family protein [Paucibacter sp.]|nr:HutD family protein [Roseateles sp.]